MAVTNEHSDQYTKWETVGQINDPTELHGRLRIAYFNRTPVATGDANSTIHLVHLPAGKVRVLGKLSVFWCTALAASSTGDVGHAAYVDMSGDAVAAVEDYFISAADTATGGTFTFDEAATANARAGVFESLNGVDVVFKAETAGFTASDNVQGYVIYVVD